MRILLARTGTVALAAGLALAVTACGGGEDAANEAALNEVDSNIMFEEPANDASAMESAVNAAEPAPVEDTTGAEANTANVMGETSGGDTGGNTVDSNVSGM